MPGKGLERERVQIPPWTTAPSDYTRSRVAADEEPNGQAKVGCFSLSSSLLMREVLMSSRAQKAGESKEETRSWARWMPASSKSSALVQSHQLELDNHMASRSRSTAEAPP